MARPYSKGLIWKLKHDLWPAR